MTTSVDDVYASLYDIVKAALPKSTTLIWADQDGDRVKRPYVTMKVINPGTLLGRPEASYDEDADKDFVLSQRSLTLSVNAFGVESEQKILELQQALSTEKVSALMDARNISLIDEGTVADLSIVVDSGFETRFQLDIEFGWSMSVDDSVGTIETVIVNGEQVGPAP